MNKKTTLQKLQEYQSYWTAFYIATCLRTKQVIKDILEDMNKHNTQS